MTPAVRRGGATLGRYAGPAVWRCIFGKKKCQILGEMLKRMTNMSVSRIVFLIKKCVNMQILIHMSFILTFLESVVLATVPFLFVM